MIAEGDTVVARVTLTGTHEGEFMGIPPTDKKMEVNEIHIYRLKDGKAIEQGVAATTSARSPTPAPDRNSRRGRGKANAAFTRRKSEESHP